MKFALRAFLLLLLALAAGPAHGAHVLFNFHDFITDTTGLTNRRVLITPKSTPRIDNGKIVPSDRLSFLTDSNASFTASNVVYGTYYVEVPGPFTVTPFQILVPDTNTLLNVTGLLATVTVPASTAGYTQTQVDAMFATNTVRGIGAGTNIVAVTNNGIVTLSATASGSGGTAGNLTLGTGSPEGSDTSTPLYFDVTEQSLWLNQSGTPLGWILLFTTGAEPYVGAIDSSADADELMIGTGSPEGAVTANPSQLFWNSTGSALWLKQSGTGNTGWIPLLSF